MPSLFVTIVVAVVVVVVITAVIAYQMGRKDSSIAFTNAVHNETKSLHEKLSTATNQLAAANDSRQTAERSLGELEIEHAELMDKWGKASRAAEEREATLTQYQQSLEELRSCNEGLENRLKKLSGQVRTAVAVLVDEEGDYSDEIEPYVPPQPMVPSREDELGARVTKAIAAAHPHPTRPPRHAMSPEELVRQQS